MAGGVVQPTKVFLGPPPPAGTAWLARATMIALIIVVGHWVHAYLGGVSTSPTPTDPITGANDTKQLFNWHPVLMTLAFGVFMAEAILTYSAPLVPNIDRPTRKKIHASLHGAAALCAVLGVTAAFKSHSLALPTPMPDLYSPHSFLGLMVLVMLSLQFVVGFGGYLWPQFSLPSRLALGPLHKFSGKLVWVAGLAAMATGLQEKTTFTQLGRNLSGEGLYSPVIRLPATAQLLLVLLAALVLFHQVPPAKALDEDRASRLGLLTGTASDEGYTQA